MGEPIKAAFLTLGCKVNQYETDAMRELLEEAGYRIVDFKEPADVYIVNTCSVTNMADRKSRQMLHRAKKNNPEAVIVAAGCYVQAAEKELEEKGIADVFIGNNKRKRSSGFWTITLQKDRRRWMWSIFPVRKNTKVCPFIR